jgi:hypothetical protein
LIENGIVNAGRFRIDAIVNSYLRLYEASGRQPDAELS